MVELVKHIEIQMEASNKIEVIERLTTAITKETNTEQIIDAVLKREATMTSAIGGEICFPHARTTYCESLVIGIATLKYPIEWGARDGKLVKVVVVIVSPIVQHESSKYLITLAKLVKTMCPMVNKLAEMKNKEEMLEVLLKVK